MDSQRWSQHTKQKVTSPCLQGIHNLAHHSQATPTEYHDQGTSVLSVPSESKVLCGYHVCVTVRTCENDAGAGRLRQTRGSPDYRVRHPTYSHLEEGTPGKGDLVNWEAEPKP